MSSSPIVSASDAPAQADTARAGAPGLVLKSFIKQVNAGDTFSAHLATQWFGTTPELVGNVALTRDNLLLVGSILQWADAHSTVCGSGFVSANARFASAPRQIVLTRGPRTDDVLRSVGVTPPGRHGDPGVLAPKLFAAVDAVPGRVGLVPHYVDLDHPWVAACRDRGIHVIDPTQPLQSYFDELQSCEAVLASSLHGLVFAHAYGRPALWIELGDRVLGNGFKFYDYYASVGVAQAQVHRIGVQAGDDPHTLIAQATSPSVRTLAANAEEALHMLHPGRWA